MCRHQCRQSESIPPFHDPSKEQRRKPTISGRDWYEVLNRQILKSLCPQEVRERAIMTAANDNISAMAVIFKQDKEKAVHRDY